MKVEEPLVCIKLPASFKKDKLEKYTSGGMLILKDGSKQVKLSWVKGPTATLEEGVAELAGSVKTGKAAVWGDTPGKGRWVSYEQPNGARIELSMNVVKDVRVECISTDVPGACVGLTIP